jgi:hypothetical protein
MPLNSNNEPGKCPHHACLTADAEKKLAEDSLSRKLQTVIDSLPPNGVKLAEIRDLFGQEGLMLLTIFLTIPFMVPVSIPGVSTIFGASILLIGVSRILRRKLWIPQRYAERTINSDKLRSSLTRGLAFFRKLEKLTRAHRLHRIHLGPVTDAALILGAILLMAPFGFVPFSNSLPGLAILLIAIGIIERDGAFILAGHIANIFTIAYFTFLLAGGEVLLHRLYDYLKSLLS